MRLRIVDDKQLTARGLFKYEGLVVFLICALAVLKHLLVFFLFTLAMPSHLVTTETISVSIALIHCSLTRSFFFLDPSGVPFPERRRAQRIRDLAHAMEK